MCGLTGLEGQDFCADRFDEKIQSDLDCRVHYEGRKGPSANNCGILVAKGRKLAWVIGWNANVVWMLQSNLVIFTRGGNER